MNRETEKKKGTEDALAIDHHKAPEAELIPGTAGKGFVGVLFALLALGVVFWVGTRLAVPFPGYITPEEAVSEAISKGAGAASASKQAAHSPEEHLAGDPETYEQMLAGFASDSDPVCGMTLDKSSNLVAAKFESTWVGFDSLACFYQYSAGKTYEAAKVLNFSTWRRNPESRDLVELENAVYLIDIDGILPGAMPPGVAAFRTRDEAEAAMGDLGGTLADFGEMKKYVTDWLVKEGMM